MSLVDTVAVKRLADWDGDRLERLAAEHGTPLYVTDLDRIRENFARFSSAFEFAHVMYAAKANTGRAVVRALYDAGADIECAAAGELHRALAAGVAPEDLQYTAVNPPDGDLDYAVDLQADTPELTITVGAEMTLDRLEARGFDGRLAIRVNPGIGTGHHEKVATGKDAKFGVPYDEVPESSKPPASASSSSASTPTSAAASSRRSWRTTGGRSKGSRSSPSGSATSSSSISAADSASRTVPTSRPSTSRPRRR